MNFLQRVLDLPLILPWRRPDPPGRFRAVYTVELGGGTMRAKVEFDAESSADAARRWREVCCSRSLIAGPSAELEYVERISP